MKTKAIYFLYRFLQALGWPVLLFYFLWRSARNAHYFGTLGERLGFLPRSYKQNTPGAIWLHAVSVGEVLASLELMRRLRERFPRSPLFVSTSTLAGHAAAEDKLRDIAAGVFYAPLDYVFAVRRVLRTLQPLVVAVAETEIWPNMFREARRAGCGLLIFNGRISDRALPRYTRLRPFFASVLPHAGLILAQNEEMRERFLQAGAPPERVAAAGNLKYDFEPREAPADSPVRFLLARLEPAEVWIAASTMPPAAPGDPDEDDTIVAAFRELAPRHPGLLLILAPRRPERFDPAARRLEDAGIPCLRRSALGERDTLRLPGVLLLDTIGELAGLFPLADVVFMGGTLASRGGHNILEPALFGRPVIVGPHMENFRDIAAAFREAGASVEIAGASELAGAVDELLRSPTDVGRRALACARSRRGAAARTVEEIHRLSLEHFPSYRPPLPALLFLWPLSKLWQWGGFFKRGRDLDRRRRLRTPVVSVGNITMGGTGKTPTVLRLAERFHAAGVRPGILTRGYGRHSPEKHLVVEPGDRVPVQHTGDEPQIFLRSSLAYVGIGPDRFYTGWMLQERFEAGVLILDDGFQHLRLARDLDIVLVDALNPFGGGAVFPLGRLREPLPALTRAGIFVITRSAYGPAVESVEAVLRRHNPRAPIFKAGVAAQEWVDHVTGERLPASAFAGIPAGGFCGLGNPRSFWATLNSLGIEPLDCHEFEDHHTYRPHELRCIADQFRRAGAHVLLTTQKDSLNLCESCDDLVAPLRIYWLQVRMEFEREEEFWRAVESRVRVRGSP